MFLMSLRMRSHATSIKMVAVTLYLTSSKIRHSGSGPSPASRTTRRSTSRS